MELKLKCLQIDLARQKETEEYIFSYIDFAKDCGYNYLMIYFENYIITEETEMFDRRECYTKEEVKRIVEYALSKGIGVIPSLQNLSYLTNIFKYDVFSKYKDGEGRFGKSNTGCPLNEKFVSFIDKYVSEVLSLFPCEYVHMGFDEQFDFALCDKCEERVKKDGSKDKLLLDYIVHTHKLVTGLGKMMMMWDDWLEYADIVNDLPRDIILINWNYSFFSGEPKGHWTNRVKRDAFAIYDELGFDYVFAFWAGTASSVYNVETFTRYAEKHDPIGAVATTWENSDKFYNGIYPLINYTGSLWNGRIKTAADKVACFAEFLGGDTILAEKIANYTLLGVVPNLDPTERCSEDTVTLYSYRNMTESFLKDIESAVKKLKGASYDTGISIYCAIYENYLNMLLCKLSEKVFDCYEGLGRTDEYISELDEIEDGYKWIYSEMLSLWEKYRKGVKSKDNALANKFGNISSKLEEIRRELSENAVKGVLFVDYAAVEQHYTVKTRIVVKYADGTETEAYNGSVKSDDVSFESGGSYTMRFAINNAPVENVKFYAYGEGAFLLQTVKVFTGGKKYLPNSVKVICGKVADAEKTLCQDTRFAV
ncbi:MAG: family 20 glycosylhydrolase, partial [Clostridia bacterium]|nr:family 20 glycosylhydrolase [Clostridia bacterium]